MSDESLALDFELVAFKGHDAACGAGPQAGPLASAATEGGDFLDPCMDGGDDTCRPSPKVPFNESEAHRHACEVRYCVSRGREWTVEFCRAVKEKRGRAAAERLWRDVVALARDAT